MKPCAGEWSCDECGAPTKLIVCYTTLVGYFSAEGHDHDDNCLTAMYECDSGHVSRITHRRKCPVEGCDWMGRPTCFCHKGEKRGIWTNDRPARDALAGR